MITPQQIRAARAAIGWTQDQLAEKAQLSSDGIRAIEAGRRDPRVSTITRIKAALEAGGARFTATGIDL